MSQSKHRALRIARNRVRAGPVAAPASLTRRIAKPGVTLVQDAWGAPSIVAGLTPGRLGAVLRAAEQGDMDAYLTLAQDMEERDAHYGSVLSTRKLAVKGVARTVAAASDETKDHEIAEAVRRDLVERPVFKSLMAHALDALGKGFSGVEVEWERGARWRPRQYHYVDPRNFVFDRDDARTLLLRTRTAPTGEALGPHDWVVHFPELKSGIPIRGGLARLAAWSFLFKNFTVKDWVAFNETYGMPIRIGKYGPSATPEDVNTLYRAVAGIGTDAAAVIPESMKIEFQQAMAGAASTQGYEHLCDWLDRQVSKAVLGATMSTDEGGRGGRAQAEVHDDLRMDIKLADCEQLAGSIQPLIESFVDLNFGRQDSYPELLLLAEEAEDLTAWTDNVGKLVDRGLKVRASDAYERFGLSPPDDDDAILMPMNSAPAAPAVEDATPREAAANRAQDAPPARPAEAMTDALVDEAGDTWRAVMTPILSPIERLAAEADTPEAFLEGLERLRGEMEERAFVEALASATFRARAAGDGYD